ncbi:uncharacterized protein [Amphiura filiformis]|uniref:uncharacterized protein n=1 Tax=Amphiura filiformis TaxID=82378 RepID=UPI003B2149C7
MAGSNHLLLILGLVAVLLVDECTPTFFEGLGTVNVGTYRPRVFKRRERRSALFHETATPAPIPPIKTCPCSSKPCQHFGECKNLRTDVGDDIEYGFECTCFEEWEGDTCNMCDTDKKTTVCEDSCFGFNSDGNCNDSGHGHVTSDCAYGTDCSDCSARCMRTEAESTTQELTTYWETTPEPH